MGPSPENLHDLLDRAGRGDLQALERVTQYPDSIWRDPEHGMDDSASDVSSMLDELDEILAYYVEFEDPIADKKIRVLTTDHDVKNILLMMFEVPRYESQDTQGYHEGSEESWKEHENYSEIVVWRRSRAMINDCYGGRL